MIVFMKLRKVKLGPLSPKLILPTFILVFILIGITAYLLFINSETGKKLLASNITNESLSKELIKVNKEFETLKKTDQVKRNDELEKTIKEVQKTFTESITVFEMMVDLPTTSKELPNYRKQFAKIIKYLSDKNYSSGSAELSSLKTSIDKEKQALIAATGGIDTSKLTKSTTPPGSGYARQLVDAAGGTFIVDLVAGNLSSTRVVVDTASDSDCRDNCPTLPLGTYVSRNGAYAGINGSYFCPADYPSCAGKTNSFDTLAMGKNKHYHNSDNNVYSTLPLVVFGSGFVRFVGQSSGWGRDTGVDGVLANQPLLVSGGSSVFGGDGDPKKGSKGNRSFVANKGSVAYIGVIRNATVAEASLVLQAMGMDGALNLDSGGSTALWASGGYKAGPGRSIPNAILFVNK